MPVFKQITESEMLSRLQTGATLLRPFVIRSAEFGVSFEDRADARLQVGVPGRPESYRFVVESKSRATPQTVQSAMSQVRAYLKPDEWPLIQVPYLSPERLEELEKAEISGVDLCGNGIIVIPGSIYVFRTGAENQYPDSRPLSNPYRGRSAMVGRLLLRQPEWESLSAIAAALGPSGAALSLPQVSKAVQAMSEDLIVAKNDGRITLAEPLRLLDRLAREWRAPADRGRCALRLGSGKLEVSKLSASADLNWAVTGESSVARYVPFSQGGPRRIAVSSLPLARSLLGGTPEPVANFADVELIETDEAGYYFDNEIDPVGIRWASRLQTWLELQAGDGRQQEAAADLRGRLLAQR